MGVKSGSQLLLDAPLSSLLRMYSKQQVYINNSGMLSLLFFLPPRFRSILIHPSFFFSPHSRSSRIPFSPLLCILPTASHGLSLSSAPFLVFPQFNTLPLSIKST